MTCEVPGGATTLLVGFYMHTWCRAQIHKDYSFSNRLDMMRLAMRMHKTCNKKALEKFYGFYSLYEKDIREMWLDYKHPMPPKEKKKKNKKSNLQEVMSYIDKIEGKIMEKAGIVPDGSGTAHMEPKIDEAEKPETDLDSEDEDDVKMPEVLLDVVPEEPKDDMNRKVYIKMDKNTTLKLGPKKKCTCKLDENGNRIKWQPLITDNELKEGLAELGIENPEKFIRQQRAQLEKLSDPEDWPDWDDMAECHCGAYDPDALEKVAELIPSFWDYIDKDKKDRRPVVGVQKADIKILESYAKQCAEEERKKMMEEFAKMGLDSAEKSEETTQIEEMMVEQEEELGGKKEKKEKREKKEKKGKKEKKEKKGKK
jgi:hypothetical protein